MLEIPKSWNNIFPIDSQCGLDIPEPENATSEWNKEFALPGLAHMLRCALQARWTTDPSFSENKECTEALDRLENVAQMGNEVAFLKELPSLQWPRCSAEDVIKVIRLALRAGAHGAVQGITIQGLKYHPNSPDVQKYARLYGTPQRAASHNSIRHLNHMVNKAWLAAHAGEYQNQWIAVRDGTLLGSAATLEELVEKVGDTKRALVTIGF